LIVEDPTVQGKEGTEERQDVPESEEKERD